MKKKYKTLSTLYNTQYKYNFEKIKLMHNLSSCYFALLCISVQNVVKSLRRSVLTFKTKSTWIVNYLKSNFRKMVFKEICKNHFGLNILSTNDFIFLINISQWLTIRSKFIYFEPKNLLFSISLEDYTKYWIDNKYIPRKKNSLK